MGRINIGGKRRRYAGSAAGSAVSPLVGAAISGVIGGIAGGIGSNQIFVLYANEEEADSRSAWQIFIQYGEMSDKMDITMNSSHVNIKYIEGND